MTRFAGRALGASCLVCLLPAVLLAQAPAARMSPSTRSVAPPVHRGTRAISARVDERGARLTLDGGLALTIPAGLLADETITLRRVAAVRHPCRIQGFHQVGDTLILEGRFRAGGVSATLALPPAARPARAPRSAQPVLAVSRPAPSAAPTRLDGVLRARSPLALRGVGERFQGTYEVTAVRHTMDGGGWEGDVALGEESLAVHFGWLARRRPPASPSGTRSPGTDD